MRHLTYLIALIVGSSACSSRGPVSEPTFLPAPAPSASVLRLGLATSATGLAEARAAVDIDFDVARDLWIRLDAPRLDAITTVTLNFDLPNGELFKTVSRVFSTNPAVTEVPGTTPIPVFPATPVADRWQLDLALPISGSAFTRRPHPGKWIVHATLSGHPEEVAAEMNVAMGGVQ